MSDLQVLGDVLGGVAHMGQCPCGSQHVSRSARVLVRGDGIYCEQCAARIIRRSEALSALTGAAWDAAEFLRTRGADSVEYAEARAKVDRARAEFSAADAELATAVSP